MAEPSHSYSSEWEALPAPRQTAWAKGSPVILKGAFLLDRLAYDWIRRCFACGLVFKHVWGWWQALKGEIQARAGKLWTRMAMALLWHVRKHGGSTIKYARAVLNSDWGEKWLARNQKAGQPSPAPQAPPRRPQVADARTVARPDQDHVKARLQRTMDAMGIKTPDGLTPIPRA